MAGKRSDQIDKIFSISLANFGDTWVMIDSDELDLTGKMRLSELLDFIYDQFVPRGFKFSNDCIVGFSNGRAAEITGGL